MLSVKAREAVNIIFKVFGMTQLRIKPVNHASQANALTSRPQSWHKTHCTETLQWHCYSNGSDRFSCSDCNASGGFIVCDRDL